jgi:hypothetical protein
VFVLGLAEVDNPRATTTDNVISICTRKPSNLALAYPVTLRDGGIISTMAQAAHLITQQLPKARQEKPVWQYAAELMMHAIRVAKK